MNLKQATDIAIRTCERLQPFCSRINIAGNISGIYKIICIANNKIYIGSAKNLRYRLRGHFNMLVKGNHKNRHLQLAFNLYGQDSFVYEIIEYVSQSELLIREQHWLDITKCYENNIGFNICKNAQSSLGIKRSPEFKEKIRIANLNRSEEIKQRTISAVKKANIGRPGWNKGIKMWRDKPAPKANLGRKFPNRKFSPEGYKKICEANRRPKSKEYKEKRSDISSKVYYFTDPEFEPVKIDNLSKFCDFMGLNKSRMY